MRNSIALFLALSLSTASLFPAPREFSSQETSVPLLELYTSEGCSSCPPAEEWFSQLRQSPDLWKKIVPVAMHVDYWNYLGWKDPFSFADACLRQREYASLWRAPSVYTPEFVLNGKEWRIGNGLPQSVKSGVLKLSVGGDGVIEASFLPSNGSQGPFRLTVAPLACDVMQSISRGENAGRTLRHDFIALALLQDALKPDSDGHFSAQLIIPKEMIGRMDAISSWVSQGANPAPIQSLGGWMK